MTAVSGVALAAGVAAVAVGGDRPLPAPAPVDEAAAHRTTTVAVPPGDQVLVCPGPARLTDGSTGGDPQFKASPVPTTTRLRALVVAGGAGALGGLGADPATLPAPAAGSASVRSATVDGPQVLRVAAAAPAADPAADTPVAPVAAGAVSSTTASGDLRGLAAASCTAPSTDQWLVGGDTRVGDSTQLVLRNAGLTAATVAVTAFGPDGEVTLGSSASLVVPPGTQVVRLLEAAAAGQDRLVVHVRASGGSVAAGLQHTSLDGIVPRGVDLVAPSAAPARAVVVAGVVTRGEAIGDPHAPSLRVLAPAHAADVTVSLWGPQGRYRLRGAEQLSLDAGQVEDVPLGGVPAGTYAVTLDASAPVVAGVEQQRPGDAVAAGQPWDLAWAPGQALAPAGSGAAPASDGEPASGSLLALPAGVGTALPLTAVPGSRGVDATPSGEVTAQVRALDGQGRTVGQQAVTVPAGTTTTVSVPGLAAGADVAAVQVTTTAASGGAVLAWGAVVASGPAAAGVSGPADGQLVSVLAPQPAAPGSGQVVVRDDVRLGLG